MSAPRSRRAGADLARSRIRGALPRALAAGPGPINIDPDRRLGRLGARSSHRAGYQVEPVVFSEASVGRTRDGLLTFANKRSDLWWGFREALDPVQGDGVALPPDRRLAAQLAAPTWRLRGNAIVIESKEEIHKRLGASTDDADAVILAWHKRDEALRRRTGSGSSRGGSSDRADGWGCECKKARRRAAPADAETARAGQGDGRVDGDVR